MDAHSTTRHVEVCQYRNCLGNGSGEVLAALQGQSLAGVTVTGTGCLGQCSIGPTVHVLPDQVWYCRVKESDVAAIADYLRGGVPVKRLLHPRFHPNFW